MSGDASPLGFSATGLRDEKGLRDEVLPGDACAAQPAPAGGACGQREDGAQGPSTSARSFTGACASLRAPSARSTFRTSCTRCSSPCWSTSTRTRSQRLLQLLAIQLRRWQIKLLEGARSQYGLYQCGAHVGGGYRNPDRSLGKKSFQLSVHWFVGRRGVLRRWGTSRRSSQCTCSSPRRGFSSIGSKSQRSLEVQVARSPDLNRSVCVDFKTSGRDLRSYEHIPCRRDPIS